MSGSIAPRHPRPSTPGPPARASARRCCVLVARRVAPARRALGDRTVARARAPRRSRRGATGWRCGRSRRRRPGARRRPAARAEGRRRAVVRRPAGERGARASPTSGRSWYRIISVNGKSVRRLLRPELRLRRHEPVQKLVHVSVPLEAACDGVRLRTTREHDRGDEGQALPAGTRVTSSGAVSGGSWTTTCAGTTVSGKAWYRITAISGKSVSSLYGVAGALLRGPESLLRTHVVVRAARHAAPAPPGISRASTSATGRA